MNDELAEWLTQIWDEQEAAALAVAPLEDVPVMGGPQRQSFTHSRSSFATEDGYPRTLSDPAAAKHFARHEPAAVLARIAADRQILAHLRALLLEKHEQWLDYCDWVDGVNSRRYRAQQHTEQEITEIPGLVYALKCSALPHADRPGYREEWRP